MHATGHSRATNGHLTAREGHLHAGHPVVGRLPHEQLPHDDGKAEDVGLARHDPRPQQLRGHVGDGAEGLRAEVRRVQVQHAAQPCARRHHPAACRSAQLTAQASAGRLARCEDCFCREAPSGVRRRQHGAHGGFKIEGEISSARSQLGRAAKQCEQT